MNPILSKRKKPVILDPDDSALFEHEYEKYFDSPIIETLIKCKVLSRGNIFNSFTVFRSYFTTGVGRRDLIKSYLLYLLEFFDQDELKSSNIWLVTNSNSTNFFHWHLDVLPKLELLNELGDATVVLPAAYRETFYNQSTNLYPKLSFVFLEKATILFNVKYLNDTAPTGNYRPDLLELLQKRILTSLTTNNSTNDRLPLKIYISRIKANKRKVSNEDVIYDLLKAHGFMVVCMEDFSYQEQVALTSKANVLLGLHGAGLTHMLFMQYRSKVIEIRAKGDSHNNCYFALASGLGHDYYYIKAESMSLEKSTQCNDFVLTDASISSLAVILDTL
jgi:hypothetical protein